MSGFSQLKPRVHAVQIRVSNILTWTRVNFVLGSLARIFNLVFDIPTFQQP